MTRLFAALAFLALDFYVYQYWATQERIPERLSFASFPDALGDWHCPERLEMNPRQFQILGATDYLLCDYQRDDDPEFVNVYVGYHAAQGRREGGNGNENSIHPPEHCLPGSGWNIIDSRLVDLDLPGLPPGHGVLASHREAKRFVIAKGEARQLVYFWYQSRGRVFARNPDVILSRMWDRATRGRSDGALVRFTTPIGRGDVAGAERRVAELAARLVPALQGYVPD